MLFGQACDRRGEHGALRPQLAVLELPCLQKLQNCAAWVPVEFRRTIFPNQTAQWRTVGPSAYKRQCAVRPVSIELLQVVDVQLDALQRFTRLPNALNVSIFPVRKCNLALCC